MRLSEGMSRRCGRCEENTRRLSGLAVSIPEALALSKDMLGYGGVWVIV